MEGNEIIVAFDRDSGKVVLSVAKGTTYEKAAPVLKRIAAELGAELGPDSFTVQGEPEQHIHRHEDKSHVVHRTRV